MIPGIIHITHRHPKFQRTRFLSGGSNGSNARQLGRAGRGGAGRSRRYVVECSPREVRCVYVTFKLENPSISRRGRALRGVWRGEGLRRAGVGVAWGILITT